MLFFEQKDWPVLYVSFIHNFMFELETNAYF